MQDQLVKITGNELRTDSRQLAPHLNHRHRTILENIDKYRAQLERLGRLPFESEKGKALPQGGFAKPVRYALLNEDQCYFLLTLMRNNPVVVKAKLRLVQAFREARSELSRAQLERQDGKQVRKLETMAIADMVEYAKGQGSKSADMYYANITKMTNKALGITAGQRDQLDVVTLRKIKMAETMVDIAIRDGIAAGLHYREIYRVTKARVLELVPMLGNQQQLPKGQ